MTNQSGYGFGIIGCGMISQFHAQAIQAMQGGYLATVYSRSWANADKLGKQYGCKAYNDLDRFLAHPGLDIVTIATPSGAHLEPCRSAAAAGKHVICEKPMEITLERIDEMIRLCQENRVMLAGIFPRRFSPATHEFKKVMESGRLGRITLADAYIKWYRTQEYYDSGEWRGTWDLDGGGALMNQSIHTVDLLYYLAGNISSVCAFADLSIHTGIEVEDNATAIVRFQNRALGVIEGSTSCFSNTGHPAEVQISGDAGSIFMKDNTFTVWDFKNTHPDDEHIKAMFKRGNKAGAGAADPKAISYRGHKRNFEDVVASLTDGRQPIVDGHEARKSVEIILAIYQSALAGGVPVKLPLNKTPRLVEFALAAV